MREEERTCRQIDSIENVVPQPKSVLDPQSGVVVRAVADEQLLPLGRTPPIRPDHIALGLSAEASCALGIRGVIEHIDEGDDGQRVPRRPPFDEGMRGIVDEDAARVHHMPRPIQPPTVHFFGQHTRDLKQTVEESGGG